MDLGKLGRAALAAYLVDRLTGDRVAGAITGLWTAGLTRSHREALRGVGVQAQALDRESPAARDVYADLGDRIKGISKTTQDRVQEYVRRNAEAGGNLDDLARMIRDDPSGAFGRHRAMMIARTESATAWSRGSMLGWKASGRVSKVRVFDGDGCGWSRHDDSDKADGSIRDLEDIVGNETAHPHCVRSFAPVVDLG